MNGIGCTARNFEDTETDWIVRRRGIKHSRGQVAHNPMSESMSEMQCYPKGVAETRTENGRCWKGQPVNVQLETNLPARY